jgi:hypothetical protein
LCSLGICCSILASPSFAQTPSAGSAAWHVTAGYETTSVRDVARTTTPLDASPVAWRGTGPRLVIEHRRSSGRRDHLFVATALRAGAFAYETALTRVERPRDDRYSRIEARYEYRRYLFTDVALRGLDFGAGLQAGLSQTWLTRHIDGGLESSDARSSVTGAFVVSARYRPVDRVSLSVAWVNGVYLARSTDRHSADPASARTRSGGGWLTDLNATAAVRLGLRTALVLRFDQWDDAEYSSHRPLTTRRHAVTAGVSYGR